MNDWIEFILMCLIWYAIHDLAFKYIKNKKIFETRRKQIIIGWMIFLAVFVPYYFYSEKGSIDDSKQYYVNLFPEEDSQKNYRVPALISLEEDGFYLLDVYWSNGGSTSFYDNYNNLILGEKVLMNDDKGEDWYVELTNEMVNK